MLFVKVDDLRAGMRLGKPIYNKNGVLFRIMPDWILSIHMVESI